MGSGWGVRWVYIIAHLAIGLLLVPFCFSQIFFFILNYAYICISVRQYVHMHADVPGSQKSIVFLGAGVAGNCERPTR